MGVTSNGGWFNDATSSLNPFDDEEGAGFNALGETLGLSHPDNPAAKRGSPRAGEGPDRGNYQLGGPGDPGWIDRFGQGNQDIQGRAQGMGAEAGNLVSQGNSLVQSGAGSQGRGAQAADYTAASGATGAARGLGQNQTGVAADLQRFANGPGPSSAAQAQLNKGTDAALNAQIAMARSGSGFGENAAGLQAAGAGAASTIAGAANDSAMLRAQEEQAFNQQRLQAFGQAGDIYGQGAGRELSIAEREAQQQQYNADLGMRQRQLNDERELGLVNAGLGAEQAGLAASNQFLNTELAGQGLSLDAQNANLGGSMAYEQGLTDIYAIDTGEHDKTRELNQAAGQAGIGGVLGVVSGVGGAIGGMLSDARSKRNVRLANLRQRHAELV
jgi:hypothetical protein